MSQVLAQLLEQGFRLQPAGDKIIVSPRERVTHEVRDVILAHKHELLRELLTEQERERAAARVRERLARDPRITRAFEGRWRGDVYVLTLGVRDVGLCELAIPRERLTDPADYTRLLTALEGRA